MASINEIIERAETRLFLVTGLDVQIHAEDQIAEMVRQTYNKMVDTLWTSDLMDFLELKLNGETGEIVGTLANVIHYYRDIHSVFLRDSQTRLAQIVPGAFHMHNRVVGVMASGEPRTVFKVVPKDTNSEVVVWYRRRVANDVWTRMKFDTELGVDDEALLLGTISLFLTVDDTNRQAAEMYRNEYETRIKMLKTADWHIPISKSFAGRGQVPSEWQEVT